MRHLAALATLCAVVVVAPPAGAAVVSITPEGIVLVQDESGESSNLRVSGGAFEQTSFIQVKELGTAPLSAAPQQPTFGAGCSTSLDSSDGKTTVTCITSVIAPKLALGAGNDRLTLDLQTVRSQASSEVSLGLGNDVASSRTGADGSADAINGDSGSDTIRGGSLDDSLVGGEGDDRIDGQAGDDTIFGGAGDDVIGQLAVQNTVISPTSASPFAATPVADGADKVDGGDGTDRISTVDGVADGRVTCGAGIDSVEIDLKDPVPLRDCEATAQGAADQHPLTRILGGRTKIVNAAGAVTLRVRCPRNRACAGILALRAAGRTLALRRYRLARRRVGRVTMRLSSRARRTLSRRGAYAAQVVATERDTQGRPLITTARVTLRSARAPRPKR